MLPILKRLIDDEENWLKLTSSNKERYLCINMQVKKKLKRE